MNSGKTYFVFPHAINKKQFWHNMEVGTFHRFWGNTAQNKADVLTRRERILLWRTVNFSLKY